jgi:P-loop Domain of unknown function (DUF2791)
LRLLWAGGDADRLPLPDEALRAFQEHCRKQIGEAYFRTPRNTIREFLGLLAILEQNPSADWRTLLAKTEIQPDSPLVTGDIEAEEPIETVITTAAVAGGTVAANDDTDLATFKM